MPSTSIWMCKVYFIAFFLYQVTVITFVAATPSEGDVRLADGGAPNQGRIEIYSNNTWWRLCSHEFYGEAFETVCRQLNLPAPSGHFHNAEFGAGNLTFLNTRFDCYMYETSLLDCQRDEWHGYYCNDDDTVGVVCAELVYEACATGGNETEISGVLDFARGPKANEAQCKWTLHNPMADHIVLYIPHSGDDYCRNPEIEVFSEYGERVFQRYSCHYMEYGAIILEIPSTLVTLLVTIEDSASHPFSASYVTVDGGIKAAFPLSGWNPTISNVTETCFTVHWPLLSSEIGNQTVNAYIVYVNWTTAYGYGEVTGKILPSNATSATIPRLSSFEDYQVIIIAVDDVGRPYNSSAVFVRTLEGVPSAAPRIKNDELLSNGSVHLCWFPISENDRNGIILGYSISYETVCKAQVDLSWHSGELRVSAPSTSYTLNELRPGLGYRVTIAAFTSKGTSQHYDKRHVWPGCAGEGVLTEPNGTILTPNYPCEYGGRQYCHWHVNPNLSASVDAIWIQFTDFSLATYNWDSQYCWSNDFVGISTIEDENGTLLCGYMQDVSLLVPTNEVHIRFIARGRKGGGFTAWYLGLQDKPTEIQLSSWALYVNISKTSADLFWSKFPLNVSINQFSVKYTDVGTGVSVFLPVEDGYGGYFHQEHSLRPYRVFVFQIIAFTGSIENDTYSSVNVSVTTQEEAPAMAPENVHAESYDSNSITIQWDPISEEISNGPLRGYVVYYREKNYYYYGYDYLGQSINTSSSTTRVVLNNLEGGRTYEVSVAAFTLYLGPRSEWQRIIVGCGGNFNKTFGEFDLVNYHWNHIYCSWKISNVGLNNAVLLISAHVVDFRSCGEFSKIFSSTGSELFHYSRCQGDYYYYNHRVIGELVEVPFGNSSFLTAQVKLEYEGTIIRSEFVILKAGKGLDSALDSSTSWTITGQTMSSTSLIIHWSGFPTDVDAAFFIISLNQTMPAPPKYDYNYYYYNPKPRVFLHMIHSNHVSAEVNGLPVFSNFTATVFLVDTTYEVYKSQTAQVETGEGFPTHPPRNFHYEFLSADSVELRWESIPQEYHNGNVLGYTIWYRAGCQEAYMSPEVRINVSLSVTSYTLTGLHPGTKYELRIAGFTAAGIGHHEQRYFFTSCGEQVILTDNNGTIQSPGYPCGYGGIQECRWSIMPNGPISAIWIIFEDFSLSHDYGYPYCSSNDRVGMTTGPNQDEVFFCNYMDKVSVLIVGGQVDVTFTAIKNWHGHGFKASYTGVQDVFTETLLPSWTMYFENVESSSVDIHWTDFPMSMDSVLYMALMITQPNRDIYVFVEVNRYDRYIHIENLSPYSVYLFKVMAFTGLLPDNITYSSQNISVRTQPGAPSSPPPNIRLEAVQSTSLVVRWDPLPKEYHNGELQGYKVYYRIRHYYYGGEREVTAGPSDTHMLVHGLHGMTEYEVWMTAFTFQEGPSSEWQSVLIGCGGSFNQSFGMLNLTKSNWDDRTCSWEIYNVGLENAVLLISVHDVRFHYCGYEYVRVFSDHAELVNFRDCTQLRGELVEASFGQSNSITTKIRIASMESYMRTQFVVLKDGLHSALSPLNPWNIRLSNKTESSLTIDWSSGYPGDLVAAFFIISLNDTKSDPVDEFDGQNVNKPIRFLSVATNSSQTVDVINGLPPLTEFVAIVYLVDINNDIYKSNTILVETEESVPSEAPYLYGWNIDEAARSIWFRIDPIEQRYHGGRLLGYKITYYQPGREDEKTVKQVDVNTTRVSLKGLTEGKTYVLFISGFTSKGVGPNRTFTIALCGGELQKQMGQFSSPDYPRTPYIPPDQWEVFPSCHWKLRPQAPNVSVIWLTFQNLFLGERAKDGHCSGGVEIYIPGVHEYDKRNQTYICGKETNYSLLIMDRNADIEAWGFSYHRYTKEFRENNGTKFLADFKALPEESVLGQTLDAWTEVQLNTSNISALMTWAEPPNSFLHGATVEEYLLIGGEDPTKIFHFIMLPQSERQKNITGLQGRTNYTGKIIAILSDGRRGSTDWIRFQTREGIPSRNPYIYSLVSIDYSTIWVKWHQIEEKDIRGTLLGYRIHIEKANYYDHYQRFYREVTVGPDVTEYSVTGLPANTYLRVWVGAFTSVGEGVQRNYRWKKTKCGSTLYSSSGALQSPGYPEKMEYSDCIWYIHSRNNSVFIWVEHYDIPDSHECYDAYVAVGDDSGIPPYRYCGESGQVGLLAQARRIPLIYYSGREFDGPRKGFELHYFVLNESFSEATLVSDWNIVDISNVTERSITVKWPHYSPHPAFKLSLYAVVCTPTYSEAGPTVFNVDKAIDRAHVGRLRWGTNYTIEIVAFVHNTQTGEFSLRRSQKVYVETVQGVPQEPPQYIKIGTYINITLYLDVSWRGIPNDRVDGELLGYKVFYRIGNGEFSTKTVGPDVYQTNIDIVNDPEPYEIRVAGFTIAGIGPMSWPRERLGCQRVSAYSQMGVIASPGFPQSTPGGLNCIYLFYPKFYPSPVQRFRLVHVVDVLKSRWDGAPNCAYWQDDYVEWATLKLTRKILAGPFCGDVEPFAFISWGNYTDPISSGFFTGIGPHERGFNSTFFALHDFSKINASFHPATAKGYEAELSWLTSGVGEQIEGYVVLYKMAKDRRPLWSFKRTLQAQTTLELLQPLTNYTTWVLGYTASGKVYGSNTFHFTTTGELPTTPPGFSPTTPPVDRMYPYGYSAGDTELTFNNKCPEIKIPGGGMRFFDRRFRKLFLCPYGTIQFKKGTFNQRPYNFGQRYWLRSSSVIAPYWTRTDLGRSFTSGPSKVFYHIYRGHHDAEILQEATSDVLSVDENSLPEGKTFAATWVLVVTWVKLRHFDLNPITEKLTNTFQAIIVTDNIFSFVMFNYPHDGIQFSAPTSVSFYKYFTDYVGLPVLGYNSGGTENHFRNLLWSGTVRTERIDNRVGNAGIPGRWIMRIENSSGIEDSDFNCLLWSISQPDPSNFSSNPDPCPCSIFQANIDNRYTWVKPIFPFTSCFYTVQSVDKRGRKCCYYKDDQRRGALILDLPKAGTIDLYHKLEFPEQHQLHDVQGFDYCCLNSINRREMCREYYAEKRPSEGCENYEPPQRAPVFGDPHLVTLDGTNYTFNGLGEYTMINVQDGFFQLQARTKLAKGGGDATVFSAAVAKEADTSAVQCTLKEEGGLEVLINSQMFQGFHNLTNVSVLLSDSLAVSRPQSNSFLVSFPSGISVTITEIQGSLSIVFASPSSLKGDTKGLLGTWNGDQSDDFLTPDGTIVPSNATGRQIHFNFGLKWQLFDNTTLFTYKPGEGTSTFSNSSFVPIFLDEPINFASDKLREAAELACQGDVNCLFDIASTRDVSVGESTKQVSIQLESESEALENFPPKILVGPTEVNVTVNTIVAITISAEDPNNDSLSFSVAGNLPVGYTTTSNQTSITLSWSVTIAQIEVEFRVSDGKASTVFSPAINVCACQNQGTCVQEEAGDDIDDSDDSNPNNSTYKFNILPCTCQNGYTGSFCEMDLDACEENFQPCFPGVTCIDLPPSTNGSGYTCEPCPSGYSGDGEDCTDINECDTNNGGCDHTCINTPGSSVCDCDSGYDLNQIDKTSCLDEDECQPVSDCMHICENTPGSYNCECKEDFKVDPTDSKKCIPKNPCPGNHDCQHVCFQSDGQQKCSCHYGYSLNQDGKRCSDIDECATEENKCHQDCANTDGSYTCSCKTGFELDSNEYACNDVDECLEPTFQCEHDSQMCENTHGSYKCVCGEGLYWIDNRCQGLDKDQLPPPPPPASEPRTPSQQERIESVNLDIQGLNTSEWNKLKEDAFKESVATAAIKYCAGTESNCISSSSRRKRRSANSPIFTEDEVHLLPDYPKQITQVPLVAVIAFYLQAPRGSSSAVINKNILVSIVEASVTDISAAISANISSVQQLFVDTTTAAITNSTTTASKKKPTEKDYSKAMLYIIAGVVSGVMLLLIVGLIVVWQCTSKDRSQKVHSELSYSDENIKRARDIEMDPEKPTNDIGYSNDAYTLSLQARLERLERQVAPRSLVPVET